MNLFILSILCFCLASENLQANSCVSLFKKENTLRLSSVQYLIEGNHSLDSMMSKITRLVQEAKEKGSELVVFPELFIFDLLRDQNDPQIEVRLREIAETVTPILFERIADLAQRESIAILAGSTPILENNRIYNRAMIVFQDGQRIFQDKLFLTPDELDWGWASGTRLQVFNAPWGKTTILICYDCEFPIISNLLARSKPEVILIPSMTESRHGFRRVRWSAKARAIEHRAYVVHTGNVGYLQYGQAATMTPSEAGHPGIKNQGKINKFEIVTTDLDIGHLRQTRLTRGPHPARDQNSRIEPIEVIDE
ncbi:MAG: nitrilase-related carbon-nitrogen hydrolase [Bdellovibrionota bacterium]